MKNLNLKLLAGIFLPAFLLLTTPTFGADTCAEETKETVLQTGINDNPDLLMAELEGIKLENFWNGLREQKILIGSIGIDKVYVFYSENHPHWVYVFFLRDGCIVDVKFTYKNLIEEMIKWE